MSTAYPPRLIKYAFSAQKEKKAANNSASSMTPGNFGEFPDSVLLYYGGPGDDFLSQRFFLRENTEEKKKLYAITYNKGPGFVQLNLYGSIAYAPPTLAISTTEKRFASSVSVTVPPKTASQGGASQTIPVKYSLRRKVHSFTITLGGPGNNQMAEKSESGQDSSSKARTESFEWREGKAIKPKERTLWKLRGQNSVTEELMVTWKEGTVPSREGRLALFEFASDEAKRELGAYGALVAISSVLAISAIFGSAIDGVASWQQEKALEKGYEEGYWQQDDSILLDPSKKQITGPWVDPWRKGGPQQQDHGKPEQLY